MHDAPHVSLARAALVHAARRLATALGPRSANAESKAEVLALERSVAAYVATYGGGRDREELTGMVTTRVRSALWTDDFAGHPAPVIATVVDVARRAVDTAVVGPAPDR